MPVEGNVTLDGKPLEAGAIIFQCDAGEEQVTAVGYIENGVYSIEKELGPVVGKARIEFQPKPLAPEAMEAGMKRGRSMHVVEIPAKYGKDSTLTANVEKSGENRFDYDLLTTAQKLDDAARDRIKQHGKIIQHNCR